MKMNWKVQEHKMTLQKYGYELKCSRAQDDIPKGWKWTKEFKSIRSQNLQSIKTKKTSWEGGAWVAKNFKTFELGMSSLEFEKHLAVGDETIYQVVVHLVNNMLITY